MRIFIAIDLDISIKTELERMISHFKDVTQKGSFSRTENLHLTLLFLGETHPSRVDIIKQVMNGLEAAPFELGFTGLGSFKRKEGDIFWLGADDNPILKSIHKQLYVQLDDSGFQLENRPFKPHLTLGRRIITNHDFNRADFNHLIPHMKMQVDKISLMKSEHIKQKLVYTEIYVKDLHL